MSLIEAEHTEREYRLRTYCEWDLIKSDKLSALRDQVAIRCRPGCQVEWSFNLHDGEPSPPDLPVVLVGHPPRGQAL